MTEAVTAADGETADDLEKFILERTDGNRDVPCVGGILILDEDSPLLQGASFRRGLAGERVAGGSGAGYWSASLHQATAAAPSTPT
jgi:hypothetical protein